MEANSKTYSRQNRSFITVKKFQWHVRTRRCARAPAVTSPRCAGFLTAQTTKTLYDPFPRFFPGEAFASDARRCCSRRNHPPGVRREGLLAVFAARVGDFRSITDDDRSPFRWRRLSAASVKHSLVWELRRTDVQFEIVCRAIPAAADTQTSPVAPSRGPRPSDLELETPSKNIRSLCLYLVSGKYVDELGCAIFLERLSRSSTFKHQSIAYCFY
ncbi:hypothetical protein EVAR_102268_1 [Eumeta japonica]|uniref:Uncharacterized protein n=1 Tax=Eumeta variegata TaxID=151549 RepID=A0A4C1WHG4_EUMVA|nr:hypothetical protein EVAR_102268_1 [Eumeta japonica]